MCVDAAWLIVRKYALKFKQMKMKKITFIYLFIYAAFMKDLQGEPDLYQTRALLGMQENLALAEKRGEQEITWMNSSGLLR